MCAECKLMKYALALLRLYVFSLFVLAGYSIYVLHICIYIYIDVSMGACGKYVSIFFSPFFYVSLMCLFNRKYTNSSALGL